MEKNKKMSFNGRHLAEIEQIDRSFMFMKKMTHGGVSPCPEAIYMYKIIVFRYIAWAFKAITSYGASLGSGKKSIYKWSRSHDQDGLYK